MALPYSQSEAGPSHQSEIRAILKKPSALVIGFIVDDA